MDHRPASPTSPASLVYPDQLASVASEAELKVNRLSRGCGPSFSRQARLPGQWGLDLTELNSRVSADGALRPGKIAVVIVFQGGDSTICGIPLREGLLVTLPPGGAIEANIHPGASFAGAVMDADRWLGSQTHATGMAGNAGAVQLPATSTRRLRALATNVVARLEATLARGHAEPAAGDIFDAYSASLAEACALGEDRYEAIDRSVDRRVRQAHRARDFIQAHIDEPIPVLRLCAEIGVSRRQLEYAFRTTFDISPRDYIHISRLNEIRRALIAGREDGRSITRVALDHGINHLGRFSADYRRLFGEAPSDTASRHRRA